MATRRSRQCSNPERSIAIHLAGRAVAAFFQHQSQASNPQRCSWAAPIATPPSRRKRIPATQRLAYLTDPCCWRSRPYGFDFLRRAVAFFFDGPTVGAAERASTDHASVEFTCTGKARK
jgi:hypothetical protein